MPDAKTFFRHCPSCGRRFEIRLLSKKLTDLEQFVEKEKVFDVSSRSLQMPLVLSEDLPCVVDVEDFRYTYRCKHCGHEWSEVREKEDRKRMPEGFTGD